MTKVPLTKIDRQVLKLLEKREELWRKWEDSSGLEKNHYEKQLLSENE